MDKKLFTVSETAMILSLGRSKVYELIRLGVLPSIVLGRARRIPAKSIEEFIAKHLESCGEN